MKTGQEHNNEQCTMNNVQWRKVKLEEVGEINPSNKEPIHSQFVYIDLESVVAGKLLVENHILRENAPSRAQRLVYYNDVLYQTVRPYQRNNYIHKKQGNYVASTGYALIRCYDDYEPDFVYYLLHTHNFESIVLGLCSGTSYPAIAPNNLKRIKISIPFKNGKPDLAEQRRIAAILASADKVIAATQKTIAKYKQIKQGMMEDLLKPKEGWKKVKLGEVGEIISGGTPSTTNETFWDGDVLFVTPLDLGRNNKIDSTLRTISELGVKNSSANKIKAHSLAISTRAPIGLMSIVNQNFTTNQGCKSIQFYDNYDSEFFYYYLSYNIEIIRRYGQGTTFMEISKTDFSNLEITVPDLPAQRRIAAILSGIDAKIAAEEKVLQKYEKVKKGLMERLLNETIIWNLQ